MYKEINLFITSLFYPSCSGSVETQLQYFSDLNSLFTTLCKSVSLKNSASAATCRIAPLVLPLNDT